MSKAPMYLPITLLDVFELVEDDRVDEIYIENGRGLELASNLSFNLKGFKINTFYVKQEYIPKCEQEDATHGN